MNERPWAHGRQTAISLTFDDGLSSQLNLAVPILDRYGLRGTFYLNPRDDGWREQLSAWKPAAESGHEIGNHTCRHNCTRSMGAGPKGGLEDMTLQQVEADILQADERLKAVFPGKSWSFCYPCYNQHVGVGADRTTYVPIVAKHFIAGRGGTPNRGYLINADGCDLAYLEAQQAELMSGYEMVGLCERAAAQNKWLILVFHGILEGHLSVSQVDFEELCAHLARFGDRFHVAPVVEIAQDIARMRARTD